MMWYPARAAFRSGRIGADFSTFWNDDSIGNYSFASGLNIRATGIFLTSMGLATIAHGYASVSLGANNLAGNYYSIAIGVMAVSNGLGSVALGGYTEAGHDYSVALGNHSKATGNFSTAMGSYTQATGNYSTAMGSYVTASGEGSMIIGDLSYTQLDNNEENRFTARFSNGYNFYTNSDATIGAQLTANSNSWSTISDSLKKENFKPVDSEEVLNKISGFKLTSWNYKSQDKTQYRHYGPMAQDFYNAFGNDGIGIIGNDMTIAGADFDGINFIAIQALEKRTSKCIQEIDSCKNEFILLKEENQLLKKKLSDLEKKVQDLIETFAGISTSSTNDILISNHTKGGMQ
jgi:Chaperone of endosialidase/YadA head domain repeat (2 copies)